MQQTVDLSTQLRRLITIEKALPLLKKNHLEHGNRITAGEIVAFTKVFLRDDVKTLQLTRAKFNAHQQPLTWHLDNLREELVRCNAMAVALTVLYYNSAEQPLLVTMYQDHFGTYLIARELLTANGDGTYNRGDWPSLMQDESPVAPFDFISVLPEAEEGETD